MELAVSEQVYDKPKGRWLWVVGIVLIVAAIMVWGYQTAIQMEEGPADSGTSAPAS